MMVRVLKPVTFIPPVVALAIAGTWLGSQRQSISTLEKQSAVLRQAIADRSSGTAIDSPQGKSAPTAKAAKDKESINWKQVAEKFAEMRQAGGMADMREIMRFQQRLQAMSKEELVAALDEIAALDFPEETRNMLEQMIIGPLVEKDPELALTKFIDRLQDNGGALSWQLSNAMQQWAKKDPAAAIAWFDKQIAAGKFDSKSLDGRSQSRIQFEGNLIRVLLSSDPDAAGLRLAALPEDQRRETLSRFAFQPLKEEDQLAFAKLVRDQVSEKDQAQTLAQQAARLAGKDGYSKVTGFLDRIQATPAERSACVEQAAESSIRSISHRNKITREDIDTMREWVSAQAPESTGSVTGKVLANALQGSRKMEFSEAAELAVQYHEASGNNDVLSSFLESWPVRQNKEQARVLAGKISDPERREEILKNLQ
jgi:cell fate (sporulation/competence/biofilm development) regulator YlbF (YheA/YmcA/DUF963 family)